MKLINKDALVAEIDKIIADETESIKSFEHHKNISEVQRSNARIGMLMYIRSLLDTLEVKEVDLEKEIELVKGDYEQVDVAWNNDFDYIARHFFELGMAVSNKEKKVE